MKVKGRSLLQFAAGIGLAFCLLFSQAAAVRGQSAPQPKRVTVEKNQLIELALETPITSASANEEDQISFRLTAPLISSGETVLPQGWTVRGRITKVVRAGKGCKYGAVDWRMEDAVAPDGTRIKLRTASAYRSKENGQLIEPNPPLSSGQKFDRALVYVLLSPLIGAGLLLISPWLLLDAIEPAEPCNGVGSEMLFREGSEHHAAIRKSVRMTMPLQTPETPQTSKIPDAPKKDEAPVKPSTDSLTTP
ncbi:MAG TPA: hypothetical protein VKG84_07955 [Candidatus Acidoferrales bacterium]|nr:hypothetical protein [Candidatus Acidoferrales bacterium]